MPFPDARWPSRHPCRRDRDYSRDHLLANAREHATLALAACPVASRTIACCGLVFFQQNGNGTSLFSSALIENIANLGAGGAQVLMRASTVPPRPGEDTTGGYQV
jgi:hypothetical protein